MDSETTEKVISEFLSGGFEMGNRVRQFNWSQTALGPSDRWPQSLKSALSICLNSNFPIAIYWGKELVLLYNDAWISIPGEKHPWALGQAAKEVWPEIWNDIEPQFQKAFNGIPGGSKDALLPMKRHGYTEECYFDFTFTPIFGEAGKVEGIFNAVIETTYRVINERRNSFLQRLSNRIVSSSSMADLFAQTVRCFDANAQDIPFSYIYVLTKAGTFELVAATSMQDGEQYPKPKWPVDGLYNGAPSILLNNLEGYFHEVPRGPWPESPKEAFLTPIKGTDGSVKGFIVFGISARRKFDKDYQSFFEAVAGSVTTVMNAIRSLQEERERAEALAEIDKAKTIFFTNISHEFRTPLTLMLGPLEELINDANRRMNDEERKKLATTYSNALRLLKLVNSLLDFSRLESGRLQSRFSSTDIVAYTRNLASNFRPIIEKAGLEFIIEGDVRRPIYIDRMMWEKIIFNLLSNAFKYTLKGTIRISLAEEDGQMALRVQDTGVGIPEKELPQMFERFHRVQNNAGRTFEGTGIGLSLTKELVKLHGGDISVESRCGEGSTFKVTVPFGKEHLPDAQVVVTPGESKFFEDIVSSTFVNEASSLLETHTAEQEEDEGRMYRKEPGGATILIVDDNADMRRHIETILSRTFNTIKAKNGAEALEKLHESKPDLVLTDIMMPVMDGIELLREIKKNRETTMIPVVLLTARAGEESKIEGYETGADDYLVKPFSSRELFARLNAQIELTRKRRRLQQQFRNLFVHIPVATCILRGKDHIIELANQAILEIWHKTEKDVLNKPILDLLPEGTRNVFDKYLAQVVHVGQRVITGEISFPVARDGRVDVLFLKVIFERLPEENNIIDGIFLVATDITEQVNARKKVEESQKQLEHLANAVPQLVWMADPKGEVAYYNERIREFSGAEKRGAEGWSWEGLIHEEDLDRTKARWTKAVEDETVYEIQHRVRMKDGSYRWHLSRAIPQKNEEGKVVTWFGTGTDIHKQKMAEEIIKRSEEFNRTILQNSPDCLKILDSDGRLFYINNHGLTMMEIDDFSLFKNKYWWELWDEPNRERIKSAVNDALDGKAVRFQAFCKTAKGTEKWWDIAVAAVGGTDRLTKQVIAVSRDITDIKKAEEELSLSEKRLRELSNELEEKVRERTRELQEANEMLERKNSQLSQSNKELEAFNYIASHDLNEPLRKIQMFITRIIEESGNEFSALTKNYFTRLITAAVRMQDLLDALLSYSHASRSDIIFIRTDLNSILNDVIQNFQESLDEKKAVVKYSPLPTLKVVPLQIQQLFSNLISNALKYSKTDIPPCINITAVKAGAIDGETTITSPGNGFWKISISDNGIGFEQQYEHRIFELFQRLHGKNEYSGTGIGLAICKKIVENHNGHIRADSIPGTGTTFTIYLPSE